MGAPLLKSDMVSQAQMLALAPSGAQTHGASAVSTGVCPTSWLRP